MKKGMNINEILDSDLYDGEIYIKGIGSDQYMEVYAEGNFNIGDSVDWPEGKRKFTVTRIGKSYLNLKGIMVKRLYLNIEYKHKETNE
jgi:hypothetical protein